VSLKQGKVEGEKNEVIIEGGKALL
jgi:hypothetical protein